MAISRTAYYKAHYFGMMGATLAFVGLVVWLSQGNPIVVLITLLLLFVPGRILGFFWRDQLRGLRLLREKQYEESIRHSEAFLKTLQRQPWIQHLIWFGSSSYSHNPASLAYNNIGAAEVGLGRLDAAREHLQESIRQDNLNPLPFYNLCLLAKKVGNAEEAVLMAAAAVQRGLTFGVTDKIVMKSQSRFARNDGKGIRPTTEG